MEFSDDFCLADGERANAGQSKCGPRKNVLPFGVVGELGNKEADAEDAAEKPDICVVTHFAGPAVEVSTGSPCRPESDNTCRKGEQKAEKFVLTGS